MRLIAALPVHADPAPDSAAAPWSAALNTTADVGEISVTLASLLTQAQSAPPAQRIEWRDQIAAYGDRGIEAVSPWLADGVLASFAVRVIDRAGLDGHAEAATRALRAGRKRAPEGVRDDIDWSLRRIKAACRTEAPKPATLSTLPAARPVQREKPRSAIVIRRRAT